MVLRVHSVDLQVSLNDKDVEYIIKIQKIDKYNKTYRQINVPNIIKIAPIIKVSCKYTSGMLNSYLYNDFSLCYSILETNPARNILLCNFHYLFK
jgi:hypothetical protein